MLRKKGFCFGGERVKKFWHSLVWLAENFWNGAVGGYHLFMRLPSWRWRTAVGVPLGLICALIFCFFFHPDFGTYSEGVRMGNVHEWSQVTEHAYSIISTYEGQMYLGNQSTVDPTDKNVNPWKFSSSRAVMLKYRKTALGQYVVIHYRQVLFRLNFWNGDTDYRVISVEPVDPSLAPQSCGTDVTHSGFNDSKNGPFSGRFVKVSLKGNVFKSNEVMIQKGDSGNGFQPLSITNQAVADCATLFARSGVMADINYEQTRIIVNPTAQDTNYNIIGLSRAKVSHLQ